MSYITKSRSGGQKFRERQKKQIQELEQVTAKVAATAEALETRNAYTKKRLELLERLLHCRDEQILLLQLSKEGEDKYNSASARTKVGPCVYQCIKGMTKDELVTAWKEFLTNASLLLLHMPESGRGIGPSPQSSRDIDEAVLRLRCLFKHVVVLNPELLYSLLSINLESGAAAVAPVEHWVGVVQQLNLDELQSTMIMEVFGIYQRTMNPVHKERGHIRASAGATTGAGGADAPKPFTPPPPLASSNQSTHGAAVNPNLNILFFQELEFVQKLSQSVKKEHCNRLLLCCYMFGELLSATQFAKLVFYSYPFFPDAIAIATIVQELEASGSTASNNSLQPPDAPLHAVVSAGQASSSESGVMFYNDYPIAGGSSGCPLPRLSSLGGNDNRFNDNRSLGGLNGGGTAAAYVSALQNATLSYSAAAVAAAAAAVGGGASRTDLGLGVDMGLSGMYHNSFAPSPSVSGVGYYNVGADPYGLSGVGIGGDGIGPYASLGSVPNVNLSGITGAVLRGVGVSGGVGGDTRDSLYGMPIPPVNHAADPHAPPRRGRPPSFLTLYPNGGGGGSGGGGGGGIGY